jgi:hypothetical protein
MTQQDCGMADTIFERFTVQMEIQPLKSPSADLFRLWGNHFSPMGNPHKQINIPINWAPFLLSNCYRQKIFSGPKLSSTLLLGKLFSKKMIHWMVCSFLFPWTALPPMPSALGLKLAVLRGLSCRLTPSLSQTLEIYLVLRNSMAFWNNTPLPPLCSFQGKGKKGN